MSGAEAPDSIEAIAVVGMSGRFPGARDIETFWSNLKSGIESIEFFSDEELAASGVDPGLIADPAYVKAAGVVGDVDQFDARYFGFNAREAQAMDPQQRVFLECAVHALEHAALDPDTFAGPIGVYAGVGVSTYVKLLEARPDFLALVGGLQALIGTNKDHLTTHLSYRLNLRGPSVVVQTACSTSLVAVAYACQALLTYQCDAAVAGGVSIAACQREGYVYEEGGIDSPDGHCRAFDARARGTVGGNGAGVVVLKRLSDARAAGDVVHALIRGFAVNNDGAQKVGYTAPSIQGQAEVIALAQGMAGVNAETISYVETHGTGTPLGDPIEIAALTQAFRATTARKQYCALGAVKTNIGHLDCAAGVAGLIKTVLALEHRQIPPNVHFESPNPKIDFADSPFYVSAALTDWTAPFPRRAGVSSFGIGGTNAHIVLEEAPPPEPSGRSRPLQVITVSARTAEAAERATARLAAHLESTRDLDFADVAFTLHCGRRSHEHRVAFACRTGAEAVSALRGSSGLRIHQNRVVRRNPGVAFVFPGQGSQYIGMARGLYDNEPAFRGVLDLCSALLREPLGIDIRDLLLCEPNAPGASYRLDETWLAQPALFSVEYALARTWLEWGVCPAAMLGHSLGEYTAACLAGVFTLEDALTLVAARGRLIQTLPRGAMLAVPLAASEVSALAQDVEIAAINAPAATTVAGETAAIDRFAAYLRERGIASKRLRTSHAFHSRMLDPILAAFRAEVERVPRRPPEMRYVSNVTGTWIRPADAADPEYYVRQLREYVRFSDGLATLLSEGISILLEVGPGRSLTALARQQSHGGAAIQVAASLGAADSADNDAQTLLDAVSQLWSAGVSVDWKTFHGHERRQKVVLPGYPFERQRYWIDANSELATAEKKEERPSFEQDETPAARLYFPSWFRGHPLADAPSAPVEDAPGTCWLIFRDAVGLGDRLSARLRDMARRVVIVDAGPMFEERPDLHYRLRPDQPEDYMRLLESLSAAALAPGRVLHLWSVERPDAPEDAFDALQTRGCYSVLALGQALARQSPPAGTSMVVVTSGAQRVIDTDTLWPGKSTVLGPCRSIPQEYPAIVCRAVDIEVPADGHWRQPVIDRLLAETGASHAEVTVAYRGTYRWIQRYERVRLDATEMAPGLRRNGVYLITGGLGRLGLLIARWLATRAGARLILTSRTRFPDKQDWHRLLSEEPRSRTSLIITQLEDIEQCGGDIDIRRVDVADEAGMRAALSDIRRRHGPVNGVFHCAGATAAEYFPAVASVTRAVCEAHFRPKVHGLLALDRLLNGDSPDFVIAMSSLAAVLGGLGFLPYAAANLFMDAFAETKRRDERARWISINWDGWSIDDEGNAPSGADEDAEGRLTGEQGLTALEHVIACPPGSQVLVVGGDLEDRLENWITLRNLRAALPAVDAAGPAKYTRPRLAMKYRQPASDVEAQVADVWQQLLGLEQVGVDDNFFELGGHSLLAIQVAARLRDRYRIDLSVETVFEAPTVAALSAEVERRGALRAVDDVTLETLLGRVEQMDETQLHALLTEDNGAAPAGRKSRA